MPICSDCGKYISATYLGEDNPPTFICSRCYLSNLRPKLGICKICNKEYASSDFVSFLKINYNWSQNITPICWNCKQRFIEDANEKLHKDKT